MTEIDLFSTAVFPLKLFFNDTPLGHATGFLWRAKVTEQLYIVTNWHVVAAKDFFTRANLHKTVARPNRVEALFQVPNQFERQVWKIPIRDKDDNPLWLVRPGYRCDLALIPFNRPTDNPVIVGLHPFNEIANDELLTQIGMDVFVTGYPFEIKPPALPVWKRGSIASEPQIARLTDGYMLVDTASRPGMSGSPVVQRSWGHHLMPTGGTSMDGRNRTKLLGVYSGRVPTDHPHEAQIGLVWDASYIDEIIAGNARDE